MKPTAIVRSLRYALSLALVSTVSTIQAVECGPLANTDNIGQLQQSLDEANSALLRGRRLLVEEVGQLLKGSPRTEAALVESERINREQELLESAGASELGAWLSSSGTLAAIRDAMQDKRDRFVVEMYLSLQLVMVKQHAEIQLNSVNRSLAKMSRPGLAIDVAKVRDSVNAVLAEFRNCESPKLPPKAQRGSKQPR